MDAIIQLLLQHGVLGIMCALLVLWIYRKDQQGISEHEAHLSQIKDFGERLSAEQVARVADAQRFTETALELQAKAIEACSALRESVEEYKRLGDLMEKSIATMKATTVINAARDERGRYGG